MMDGRDHAVEELNARFFHPQADVIVTVVGIDSVKMIVGQVVITGGHITLAAVVRVALPLRKFAQCNMRHRIEYRKAQNSCQKHTGEFLVPAAPTDNTVENQQAQSSRQVGQPELGLLLHDAQAPYPV
ncbi:MAG: hypothetical protein ACLRRT_16800, partial [Ruthenibacterium lactatiformans]